MELNIQSYQLAGNISPIAVGGEIGVKCCLMNHEHKFALFVHFSGEYLPMLNDVNTIILIYNEFYANSLDKGMLKIATKLSNDQFPVTIHNVKCKGTDTL